MGNENGRIQKELISKEELLLENDFRNNAGSITELIDADCIAISASGKQSQYKPGELFGTVDGVQYIDSNTVRLIDLAENCKLLLYVVVKVIKNNRIKSNCSSIWKKIDDKWKIVFHQETNCLE
jgi:hypothetical protein